MHPEDARDTPTSGSTTYWVTLSMHHERIYAEVVGTDVKASARSLATLRARLIDTLGLRESASGETPRIYWKHDGLEIPVEDGASGPTSWQILKQADVDRKAQDLRRPGDVESDLPNSSRSR